MLKHLLTLALPGILWLQAASKKWWRFWGDDAAGGDDPE